MKAYNSIIANLKLGRRTIVIIQREGQSKQVCIYSRSQSQFNKTLFKRTYEGDTKEGLQIGQAYLDTVNLI